VFARSGCRGCHVTADVPLDRPGAPLAQIAGRTAAERPPAADGEDPPDVPAFVARKVASPRVFDPPGGPAGVMPQFRTTPDEAVAIGIAVAALGGRSVPVEYRRDAAPRPFAPPPGVIADLFERKRCLSCHRIGGTGGDLSRIPLDGVGARLERAWLARFLEAPTTVRLDQPERMPVLGLSTDDAARLADYLSLTLDAAWSAEPVPTGDAARGEALYNRQGCATCHVHRGRGALGGPGLDDAPRRLRPVYLSSLLRAPERVPNGRHAAVRLSAGEAADVAAFLSTAAAPATVVPAAE
jgi:mono/diheme cytochrome c family protein